MLSLLHRTKGIPWYFFPQPIQPEDFVSISFLGHAISCIINDYAQDLIYIYIPDLAEE